ncbi:MAG: hypothetical protein EOO41_02345, partial [Methanobacteriota archaeon]
MCAVGDGASSTADDVASTTLIDAEFVHSSHAERSSPQRSSPSVADTSAPASPSKLRLRVTLTPDMLDAQSAALVGEESLRHATAAGAPPRDTREDGGHDAGAPLSAARSVHGISSLRRMAVMALVGGKYDDFAGSSPVSTPPNEPTAARDAVRSTSVEPVHQTSGPAQVVAAGTEGDGDDANGLNVPYGWHAHTSRARAAPVSGVAPDVGVSAGAAAASARMSSSHPSIMLPLPPSVSTSPSLSSTPLTSLGSLDGGMPRSRSGFVLSHAPPSAVVQESASLGPDDRSSNGLRRSASFKQSTDVDKTPSLLIRRALAQGAAVTREQKRQLAAWNDESYQSSSISDDDEGADETSRITSPTATAKLASGEGRGVTQGSAVSAAYAPSGMLTTAVEGPTGAAKVAIASPTAASGLQHFFAASAAAPATTLDEAVGDTDETHEDDDDPRITKRTSAHPVASESLLRAAAHAASEFVDKHGSGNMDPSAYSRGSASRLTMPAPSPASTRSSAFSGLGSDLPAVRTSVGSSSTFSMHLSPTAAAAGTGATGDASCWFPSTRMRNSSTASMPASQHLLPAMSNDEVADYTQQAPSSSQPQSQPPSHSSPRASGERHATQHVGVAMQPHDNTAPATSTAAAGNRQRRGGAASG